MSKILKQSIVLSPVLFGVTQADADIEIVDGTYKTDGSIEEIDIKPVDKLGKGSPIRQINNNLSIKSLRGVFQGGNDVTNIPYEDPIGSATAIIRTEYSKSHSVGSGMFISPRVLLTVAHNFLSEETNDFKTDVQSRKLWLGSNSKSNVNWVPTTGVSYDIKNDQVHFWNKSGFTAPKTEENKDWASRIYFYNDLAVVVFDEPMQFMSPYNRAEFLDLATEAELATLKNDDPFILTGYPGPREKATDTAVKKDFEYGRLYQVRSLIKNYTNPRTGKPYYTLSDERGNPTNKPNPNVNQFHFYNSSWGGFSGSGLVNTHNKVIGVLQSGRPDKYKRGDKKDQLIPDSDTENKSNGGMIFQPKERRWLQGIIDANKVTGWKKKRGSNDRYFFKEDGHLTRNETLVIDEHTWQFDARGVATDLGSIKKGNVKVRYVDPNGRTVIPEQILINNKTIGTMYSYDTNTDNTLTNHNLITSGRYGILKVSRNTSGNVVEGDTIITVTLKENVADLTSVRNILPKLNNLNTPDTENTELRNRLQRIKNQLDTQKALFMVWTTGTQKPLSELPENKVADEVSKTNRLLDEYNGVIREIGQHNDLLSEYNRLKTDLKQRVQTVRIPELSDNHVKEGFEYQQFQTAKGKLDKLKQVIDKTTGTLEERISELRTLNVEDVQREIDDVFHRLATKQYADIPFASTTVEDETLAMGVVKTDRQGENGRKEIITRNGQTTETVIKKPVDEIKRLGVGGETSETHTEVIHFDTKYIDDDNLRTGEEIIQTEGREGVRTIKKTWKTVKGVQKGEPRTEENVTTPKIDKVVKRGTSGEITESKKEVIPFVTKIIEDENLPEGVEHVASVGDSGVREFLTTYKTVKGQKTGSPIRTTNHVVKDVTNNIIHKGIKGYVTETEVVDVPFETQTVTDADLPKGTQKTVQKGHNGISEVTKVWTTHKGRKVGAPTTTEHVNRHARMEIIHIGVGEPVVKNTELKLGSNLSVRRIRV